MEREAAQLRDMQAGGFTHAGSSTSTPGAPGSGTPGPESEAMETEEDKEAADSRSVYVGNVSLYDIAIVP